MNVDLNKLGKFHFALTEGFLNIVLRILHQVYAKECGALVITEQDFRRQICFLALLISLRLWTENDDSVLL